MPDIDSPLDTRLQSFFEEIKAAGAARATRRIQTGDRPHRTEAAQSLCRCCGHCRRRSGGRGIRYRVEWSSRCRFTDSRRPVLVVAHGRTDPSVPPRQSPLMPTASKC